MSEIKDVVIAGGVRTPIGDFGGAVRDVSSVELGRIVVDGAIRRSGLNKEQVDEVIFGNCGQRSDEPNVARCISLQAGLPVETTAFTIQRQCSSGMQAIVSAYQEIVLGDAEIVGGRGVNR